MRGRERSAHVRLYDLSLAATLPPFRIVVLNNAHAQGPDRGWKWPQPQRHLAIPVSLCAAGRCRTHARGGNYCGKHWKQYRAHAYPALPDQWLRTILGRCRGGCHCFGTQCCSVVVGFGRSER